MNKQLIIVLIVVLLLALMLFFNKKVSLFRLFKRQFQVYKNDNKNKYSIWDLICFILFPIFISLLIVFGIPYKIDIKLAELLTTVFSLVFTILFGFAAVIIEKSYSDNSKKKRVIGETFTSIVTSTSLSLIAAIISILLTIINNTFAVSILSAVLLALSFHI